MHRAASKKVLWATLRPDFRSWNVTECDHACMFSRVQLFATPWTIDLQSPLSMILQARILEWVAMSSSRVSSNPGIKPMSPASPALVLYPLSHISE